MWKGVDKNSLIPKSEGLHVGWARQHEAHIRRTAQVGRIFSEGRRRTPSARSSSRCGSSSDLERQVVSERTTCLAQTAISLRARQDRKSTRLNSSHRTISYAVFCLKKKKKK